LQHQLASTAFQKHVVYRWPLNPVFPAVDPSSSFDAICVKSFSARGRGFKPGIAFALLVAMPLPT
jgi:hypothetical protein